MGNRNKYAVKIENCRNISSIDNPPLFISRNCLNVFFGKNGVGKTTICRSLEYAVHNSDGNLDSLKSYKYRESGNQELEPQVEVEGKIKELIIFNDAWIQDHCFRPSSIHENAFELYVRNDAIRKLEKERKNRIGYLRKVLESAEVDLLKKELADLQKQIGTTKNDGDFKSNAPIVNAFSSGSPIQPLPSFLKPVVRGMTTVEKAKWLSWHKNYPELENAGLCPYCGHDNQNIQDECRSYDESRSDDSISKWEKVALAYEKYRSVLTRNKAALLKGIIEGSKAPTSEQMAELGLMVDKVKKVAGAYKNIEVALSKESNIDASLLVGDLKKEIEVLANCDLFLKTKNGKQTDEETALKHTVTAIERLVTAQSSLEQTCRELISEVEKSIVGHEAEINKFLKQCGYEYCISIECNIQSSDANILLKPENKSVTIDDPDSALSYGEKNALALVLFMHEAIRKQNALVILDDPISSFDYDKRFGVLYTLFSTKSSIFSENLAGKTVLVMTHDPLVLSDLLGIHISGIKQKSIKGQFLYIDGDGKLSSKSLDEKSLSPFTQILQREIKRCKARPRIFGYVRIRQYCELLRRSPDDKKTKYAWTFNLLSGIVHGKSKSCILEEYGWDDDANGKVAMCESFVKQLVGWDIDFWEELDFYSDCMDHLIELYEGEPLTSDDKLLIVRLMIERDENLATNSGVMRRFADESCHIGGNYLFQLDGKEYDQVPFYVIDWCDLVVEEAKRSRA